jgi:hypothetical protein
MYFERYAKVFNIRFKQVTSTAIIFFTIPKAHQKNFTRAKSTRASNLIVTERFADFDKLNLIMVFFCKRVSLNQP